MAKVTKTGKNIKIRIVNAKRVIKKEIEQREKLLRELQGVERKIVDLTRREEEKKIRALRKKIAEL